MKQDILLLTKSKKYKGYCVTGINIENGEWVRFNPAGEESYPIDDFVYQDGSIPELLDIVSVDVAYSCGTESQPENVKITNRLERCTADLDVKSVLEKRASDDFDRHKKLFYNNSHRIDCDNFCVPYGEEQYSLHLIKPESIIICKKSQTKCQADIKYNNEVYRSLRITDLDFIDQVANLDIDRKYKITGDVYVVVSLAEKFLNVYNEKWESYKLVSSIIRINDVAKHSNSNARQIMNTNRIDYNPRNNNSVITKEILLKTSVMPGQAEFFNYNELRAILQEQLKPYNNTNYSIDNLDVAREDYEVLKQVRRKLSSKKKDLEREYTRPINKVIEQIDELIAMVKQPYDVIDKLLKTNKKQIKEREIMLYAGRKASILGEYAENVLESPAFFNPRWKNISYKEAEWKKDVDEIIDSAIINIDRILNGEEHNMNAKLAFFFEKLTMEGYESFEKILNNKSDPVDPVKRTEINSKPEEQFSDKDTKDIVVPVSDKDTNNRFIPGDIVCHFKRETLSPEEKDSRLYMYEIVGVAVHTETREEMMVYRALYGEKELFVRPLDMFLEEVDREKYPEIQQRYRFEKIR